MTLRPRSLPAVPELAAKRRVERLQAPRLEIRTSHPDPPVEDAKRSCWLEPESLVVTGVAKYDDQGLSLLVRPPKQLRHQGAADSLAPVRRRNGERRDPDDVSTPEVAEGPKHMADHRSVLNRNQFEAIRTRTQGPRLADDVDLFVTIAAPAAEGLPYECDDGLGVAVLPWLNRPRHGEDVARVSRA